MTEKGYVYSAYLSTKRRFSIPNSIRKAIGWKEGDTLELRLDEQSNSVVITKLDLEEHQEEDLIGYLSVLDKQGRVILPACWEQYVVTTKIQSDKNVRKLLRLQCFKNKVIVMRV